MSRRLAHGSLASLVAFAFGAVVLAPISSGEAEAATKKQRRDAMRICKRKYGKTVYKVSFRKNGQIICHYGSRNSKNLTEEQVRKWCERKYYMSASIRVYKRNGKWWCEWRS